MDSKLKGFIITFKTYLEGVGDFEFCQLVERSQIQESHRNMVKENPDFEDSDSDCDDVLRTWFLEQTLPYGDTLTDPEYDKYKTISCANLQKFKDQLFHQWLMSRVEYFNCHEIKEG